eukprot:6175373-Pleurochrysis_carterae.AAC.1
MLCSREGSVIVCHQCLPRKLVPSKNLSHNHTGSSPAPTIKLTISLTMVNDSQLRCLHSVRPVAAFINSKVPAPEHSQALVPIYKCKIVRCLSCSFQTVTFSMYRGVHMPSNVVNELGTDLIKHRVMTRSMRPYSMACCALKKLSRSRSISTLSRGWPVSCE